MVKHTWSEERDWGLDFRSGVFPFFLFILKVDKHFLLSVDDLLKDKVKTPLVYHLLKVYNILKLRLARDVHLGKLFSLLILCYGRVFSGGFIQTAALFSFDVRVLLFTRDRANRYL